MTLRQTRTKQGGVSMGGRTGGAHVRQQQRQSHVLRHKTNIET